MTAELLLKKLKLSGVLCGVSGASSPTTSADLLKSFSPIDSSLIGEVSVATDADYERVVKEAHVAFLEWRKVPAPQRGEIVRQVGVALRENKDALAELVTLETGKILAEGAGEVQEAIDIADFAVGLSRQLYGKMMHSERRTHRMYEQWHPIGPVGVITAFNFPAAVWAWNAMIGAVCGDTIIWKPSEHTPVTAIAVNNICRQIAELNGHAGIFNLIVSKGPELGKRIAQDRRIPLVSATGSTAMGRSVATSVAERLGKSILELGGNNAVIVLKDADLPLAVRGILFGAVGTAGQRCTSIRRVLVEESIAEKLKALLIAAYKQVKIGDPRKGGVLMGPLINDRAVKMYESAVKRVASEGGKTIYGGKILSGMPSGNYVEPTIVEANKNMALLCEETFAPILYIVPVKDLSEAIEINNNVPQGLSSAIFTANLKSAESFLSHSGSDCGIANVNIGTSGAEIGGAFGGEKDTGGGREAGSDSWKQYMRRQTTTINYGDEMPLAQGIKFE